jgi:molybdopterin-containing oxidoreductase family iron-sulfur binding subunit
MIELPLLSDSEDATPSRLWRSTEHRAQSAAFKKVHGDEFMPGAGGDGAPAETAGYSSGANRRQFLQLMGASMALAGLTACRRPVETILPYTRKPEEVIPGIAQYYATAMPHRGWLRPILAESHEGRPTKLEGNPDHPYGNGTSGLWEQATILNLYDPDRSRRVRVGGDTVASWEAFVEGTRNLQGPIAVLAEPTSSPTMARMQQQLADRFPGSRFVTYRAEGNTQAEGIYSATGQPLRPLYDFSNARTILSLDADFLGSTDANEVENTRSFSLGRTPESGSMSRLYVVESSMSPTGGLADHRLRMRASYIPAFAALVASRLGVPVGNAPSLELTGREQQHLDAIVSDLQAGGSQSVVLAGSGQPAEVHALAMAINSALGSVGGAVQLYADDATEVRAQNEELLELTRDLRAGRYPTLVMVGVNPVYDAPAELDIVTAIAGAEVSIHIGTHVDETAQLCSWHLPKTHFLEMWGDGRAYDGTLSIVQPLIAPLNIAVERQNPTTSAREKVELNDVHSELEIFNLLATRTEVSGYDLVRETWRGVVEGNFEEGWRRALHNGYLADSGAAPVSAAATFGGTVPAPLQTPYELHVGLDPKMLDGTYSNNAWMIELPYSVSKLVWDNVALMSRQTAADLGVEVEYNEGRFDASTIAIQTAGGLAEIPVWIQPGQADGQISVTMGWGRNIYSDRPPREDNLFEAIFDTDSRSDVYFNGPIGNGVGVNTAPLRPASFSAIVPAEVVKAGDGYELVSTQEHGTMIDRALVIEETFETFKVNPDFAREAQPLVPGQKDGLWEDTAPLWGEDRSPANQDFFKDNPYYRNQWGMTVDLTSCTGCSACVIACQAENNIQVVGKKDVGLGREMHWLRIDRYYIGEDEDDPRMAFQYLTCVHCENAPCEAVCPVAATVHSPDGTNQMVYNRCVGTRYCSNNCPYKVRRYNWFNWTKTLPLEVQMQQNPNVTVRFRGVMEKCSYCVQRIREANLQSNIEDRNIRDGEVKTACQQACAAGAIVFGDLADPDSAVSRSKQNPRRYELLAELGVKPRTSYLGRVLNPHPDIEIELATTKYKKAYAGYHAGAHDGDSAGEYDQYGPATELAD